MTVLLVLFTLIAFLTADYFVQRTRAAREREAAQETVPGMTEIPADAAIANNHTWIKNVGAGAFVIGIDEFLGRMIGAAERILLPREGAAVGPWLPAITVSARTNRLNLGAPLAGRVVSVNYAVLENPALARKDPYGSGWLLRVEADARQPLLPKSLKGGAAASWLKEQLDLAKQFFAGLPHAGAVGVSQDGGSLVEGVLRNYDEMIWKEFERRFATLSEPSVQATTEHSKK